MSLALQYSHIRQYKDMVSDQAVLHPSLPHEGFRSLRALSAIVGLMRNSLSEATSQL